MHRSENVRIVQEGIQKTKKNKVKMMCTYHFVLVLEEFQLVQPVGLSRCASG